jgi:diguanylate cyclase (GGDEF)-like protein
MPLKLTPLDAESPQQRNRNLGYGASWVRVIFALLIIALVPFIGITSAVWYVACGIYLGLAALFLVLIKRDIGGAARVWASGIVDITFLSFLIHRVGATSTALISLYVLFPVIYALLRYTRVAFALGVYGAVSYILILLGEYAAWLPVGPDEPAWASGGGRPLIGTLVWASMVGAITFATTALIARLSRRLEQRERELVLTNARLEELSRSDPLTGLFNRRRINEHIDMELARVKRGHTAALLMIDLDGFKRVNDDLGHLAGDEVLTAIAQALAKNIREVDSAGRYGGDEFVVVLSDPRPPDTSSVVGERLVRAVRRAGRVDEAHQVTASVGVAVAEPTDSADELIRRADVNVYAAKQAGGDRVIGPVPEASARAN